MLAAESNVTNCISVTMERSTPQKCLTERDPLCAEIIHHVSGESLQTLCQLSSSSALLLSTIVAGLKVSLQCRTGQPSTDIS